MTALDTRLAAVLTLLLRLEWAGSEVHHVCPSCGATRMHGHHVGCALRHMIHALTPEP